jgi:hypothetical protein
MRSLLGRFHRPFARGVDEQLLLLNNLGDGSTLSLDFTTGVLDPRLTFTRTTNATFINSQGLVQYADANMFINSAWTDANNVPQGWTLSTATGSISRLNETRTITCTAQQYWFFQQPATAIGLVYSVSFEITAITGTLRLGDIILVGSSSADTWYINGVSQGTGATGSNATATTGIVTVVFTATAVNPIMRLGLGTAGTNVTGSVTIRYPQFQPGAVPLRTYYENTSTSAARFNSARFDYDPTALTPRGLLIEGSSDNTCRNSNDIYTTGFWGSSVGISVANETGVADPSDGTQTCRIVKAAGVQFNVRNQVLPTVTVPANSTVNVTASVWMRMNGAGQTAPTLAIFDLGGTGFGTRNGVYVSNPAVTASSGSGSDVDFTFGSVTGWVRVGVTRSITNATGSPVSYTQLSLYIYPDRFSTNTATIFVWGAQFEIGAGVSSLIPTGTSTGNRAADSCVMTGTNFSSWYQSATAGTVYCEFDNPRASLGVAQTPAPANLGDYSAGNLLSGYLGGYPVGQGFSAAVWGNGGTGFQAATVATAVSVALGNKGAFAFTGQSIVGAFRGFSSATATTTGTVNAKTVLYVGANGTGGTSTRDFLNSCIQRIKFFPTQYTAAQLQALTT